MTDKEAFEKEQEELREKFYYDTRFGDKLIRFYLEMTETGVWSVETVEADGQDLPF